MNSKIVRLTNFIIPLLISCLLAPQAALSVIKIAQTQMYSGVLSKKNHSYYLETAENAEKLLLTFNDSIVEKIIQRLSTGDFVSIQADVSTVKKNTLNTIGLNYIGLNVLLGTWRGDDDVCYNFKTFTTLFVFNTNSKGLCILPADTTNHLIVRKLSYFVNPDDQDWLLLISEKSAQYAAELLIKNQKTLQLNLFDEQTGAIISKVILRR